MPTVDGRETPHLGLGLFIVLQAFKGVWCHIDAVPGAVRDPAAHEAARLISGCDSVVIPVLIRLLQAAC